MYIYVCILLLYCFFLYFEKYHYFFYEIFVIYILYKWISFPRYQEKLLFYYIFILKVNKSILHFDLVFITIYGMQIFWLFKIKCTHGKQIIEIEFTQNKPVILTSFYNGRKMNVDHMNKNQIFARKKSSLKTIYRGFNSAEKNANLQ